MQKVRSQIDAIAEVQPTIEEFALELDAWYASPGDMSGLWKRMDETAAAHPEWTPYQLKALVYETAAAQEGVADVLRHCPFYFLLNLGRHRHYRASGIGQWIKTRSFATWYEQQGQSWKEPWSTFVNFNGKTDADQDHHSIGYDNVLELGLNGLIAKAKARLATVQDEKEQSFLESAIIGMQSLITIAGKFADRAEAMLQDESDPAIRRRLKRIAEAARRCPAEPPKTFFEALNTFVFMREICETLECLMVSTLGHVDRMLAPFYEADLAAGRITREEAKELLRHFVGFIDVKFEARRARHESSTTAFVGGCDVDGNPVFNEVTTMMVEAVHELNLVDLKFQARISSKHPKAFRDLLARFIGAGTNVMAVYNDDVLVEANVKSGKDVRDARLYVGGGCQENILQNCEINSRATMFFNSLAVLDMGLHPQNWTQILEAENFELVPILEAQDFNEFYRAYMANLNTIVTRLIHNRNRLEARSWEYNPCPIISSTLDDCIDNGRDMTEGGCRYSTGSVCLAGIGTLVDSLWAVREMVFERKTVSLADFVQILSDNFEGQEVLRQSIIRSIPKYGRDAELRPFVAKVFADVADATSGEANSRGGKYVASLFAHRSSAHHGRRSGATPDGRLAGEPFSQSIGPSVLSLGTKADYGEILNAIDAIDLTDYPIVGVLDMKLPSMPGGHSEKMVAALIDRFIECDGSVLQLNVVDAEVLKDARVNPESHQDLTVRVSGFSAQFTHLGEDVQNEIIERTELSSR